MSHELQLAYETSKLTFDYNPDQTQIASIVAGGRYCIVMRSIAYCPITDATLPNPVEHLVTNDGDGESFATADEALASVACKIADDVAAERWDEAPSYVVIGPEGRIQPPAPPMPELMSSADLPF